MKKDRYSWPRGIGGINIHSLMNSQIQRRVNLPVKMFDRYISFLANPPRCARSTQIYIAVLTLPIQISPILVGRVGSLLHLINKYFFSEMYFKIKIAKCLVGYKSAK